MVRKAYPKTQGLILWILGASLGSSTFVFFCPLRSSLPETGAMARYQDGELSRWVDFSLQT